MPEHCIASILSEFPSLSVLHQGCKPSSHPITAVTLDSRKTSDQHIFIALKGQNVDGRKFIATSNSALIVVEQWDVQWQSTLQPDQWILQTSDARKIMAEMAIRFNNYPAKSLNMVGITGTNGKTTTTWMLSHILSTMLPKAIIGTIGTIGQRINGEPIKKDNFTTPESPQLQASLRYFVDSGCSICIMEVSSIGLMMKRVGGIEFDVAAFTNFTQDHLDIHGSMTQYLLEKQKLFSDHLHQSSTSILVADNPNIENTPIPKGIRQTISTQGNSSHSWWVKDTDFTVERTSFTCCHLTEASVVTLPCIGEHNIENAVVSIAIANALGVPISDAANALQSLPQTPGRLERVTANHVGYAFVDYAHTPDALEQSLLSLKKLCKGQLWIVFGCGGDRDKRKRPLMGKIATDLADQIVLTSDNPRSENPYSIIEDIIKGIPTNRLNQTIQIVNRKEAIHWCLTNLQPNASCRS